MLYEFVVANDTNLSVTNDTNLSVTKDSDIDRLAAQHGRLVTGYTTNKRLRRELRGQPKVSGMNGPMWGGYRNGEIVLRYEDPDAYAMLST